MCKFGGMSIKSLLVFLTKTLLNADSVKGIHLIRELSFFSREGGCLFVAGNRIFWGGQRGGTSFVFSGPKGGLEFFEDQREGTKFFS